eukprot:2781694-Pyramimonas_sp.AAC.1
MRRLGPECSATTSCRLKVTSFPLEAASGSSRLTHNSHPSPSLTCPDATIRNGPDMRTPLGFRDSWIPIR